MTTSIAASEAKQGEMVTTVSGLGGIGLGRLVNGVVFISGGNGWYYSSPGNSSMSVKSFRRDNGQGYRDRTAELMLPPAYKA